MRGYSTNADGDVVLTMDRRDYETVLLALGYATGGEMMPRRSMVELMNRLNDGNPEWRPYATEPRPQ
jgi:hypothetical protein